MGYHDSSWHIYIVKFGNPSRIGFWDFALSDTQTITAVQYAVYTREPGFRMTSLFIINERMGQNQRRHVTFVQFARWRHRGTKSAVAGCLLFLNFKVILLIHGKRVLLTMCEYSKIWTKTYCNTQTLHAYLRIQKALLLQRDRAMRYTSKFVLFYELWK